MIDIHAKIHDRFSVEFKVGFIVGSQLQTSDFIVNSWIFVPNSLDLNPLNYDKERFYRDIRSNVRLITPVYTLTELGSETNFPYDSLKNACQNLASEVNDKTVVEYEAQIKMFVSIVKSAIRDKVFKVRRESNINQLTISISNYKAAIEQLSALYRNLLPIINIPQISPLIIELFRFGDEFLCNLIERSTYVLIQFMQKKFPEQSVNLQRDLFVLVAKEMEYKKQNSYLMVDTKSPTNNQQFLFRIGALKKYIESDLYLTAKKKKNTFLAEQVSFSLAAGMSMIFATVIAFSFQRKFGTLTMPLFIALVISYMFKDRIKDLLRYYFAHKLSSKFFDHKTNISIKNQTIGWIKEGFDFIPDNKVPEKIMEMRNRSTLLEAENRRFTEKIMLFRKRVRLNGKLLRKVNSYIVPGINDIVRINLSDFIRKMDNPEIPLFAPNGEFNYEIIHGEKIYYLNFIIQCKYQELVQYKRYRIVLNKQGIKRMETF